MSTKTNKQKAQEILDQFVVDGYDERTNEISRKNLELSMKLSGLLSMLDAYFTAYHQNRREIVNISKGLVLAKATSEAHKKYILRKTQNQYNKLDNQAAQFDKFVKRFGYEFNSLFGDTDLGDQLIDTFEAYWSATVTLDDKAVTIKTD